MVIFKITVICYVQLWIWHLKLWTPVSLQTTTRSELTLEPCNNLISYKQNKIFFFFWSNNKRSTSWKNSRTELLNILLYLFDQLIFVFTLVQKLLPIVTLWHILFKTCIVELSGRSTSFLSCHILNTVYLIRVINKPQQFHSYRTIWEYEPDQCRNPFFIGFLVLSILLKPYRH